MRKKIKKPYWEMTKEELAEATKEFDRPIPMSKTRPLTKQERERFERARRAGSPGIRRIWVIDVDNKLVDKAFAYAKRKQMSFSQIVERGLRRELAVKD